MINKGQDHIRRAREHYNSRPMLSRVRSKPHRHYLSTNDTPTLIPACTTCVARVCASRSYIDKVAIQGVARPCANRVCLHRILQSLERLRGHTWYVSTECYRVQKGLEDIHGMSPPNATEDNKAQKTYNIRLRCVLIILDQRISHT